MSEPIRLAPESVREIAEQVASIMLAAPESKPKWVDASEVARMLGVGRAWVYSNAERLGAQRLNDGPKARLRFDAAKVAAFSAIPASSPAKLKRVKPRRRRRTQRADLLPVKGEG
jgi:hypothetical protein